METQTKPSYGDKHAGCWFDNCRGIYIGEAIIAEAKAHGFAIDAETQANIEEVGRTADLDCYHELTDEAEEFMQQFAEEGYSFGFAEWSGDWGLWSDEEDEE